MLDIAPRDILVQIFAELDLKSVAKCGLLNKSIHQITCSHELWRLLFLKMYGKLDNYEEVDKEFFIQRFLHPCREDFSPFKPKDTIIEGLKVALKVKGRPSTFWMITSIRIGKTHAQECQAICSSFVTKQYKWLRIPNNYWMHSDDMATAIVMLYPHVTYFPMMDILTPQARLNSEHELKYFGAQIILALEELQDLTGSWAFYPSHPFMFDKSGNLWLCPLLFAEKHEGQLIPSLVDELKAAHRLGTLFYRILNGTPKPPQENFTRFNAPHAFKFKEEWSVAVRDLIAQLVEPNEQQRLHDLKMIKEHKFFANMDWKDVTKKRIYNGVPARIAIMAEQEVKKSWKQL